MRVFTFGWKKIAAPKKLPISRKRQRHLSDSNVLHIQIDALDEQGQLQTFKRTFNEWLAVCTKDINKVLKSFQTHFPDRIFKAELLRPDCIKVLPYFQKRLDRLLQNPNYVTVPKPLYKVYTTASIHEVGEFYAQKYKIALYQPQDWLVKISIDFCTRYNSLAFFHKWYTVDDSTTDLLTSFHMHPDDSTPPDWTFCSFDLETAPSDGGQRVPNGLDPNDIIVMISVVMWNLHLGTRKWLFYLDPLGRKKDSHVSYSPPADVTLVCCPTEDVLLRRFHVVIQQCHVLTGYNINRFDIPCLFARLTFLNLLDILTYYSSTKYGENIVATFQNKIVIDMYHYVRMFSGYDLPGFKLDEVAKVKLGESKLPVASIGIHAFYLKHSPPSAEIVASHSVSETYEALQPRGVAERSFGTFGCYLEYCMRDSEIVRNLFDKESVMGFLVERGNMAAIDAQEACYIPPSCFLLLLFKTYSTSIGFFFNETHFVNQTDLTVYGYGPNQKYQGALNYCEPLQTYTDVSVLDFSSMYPSALLSSNLCYSTCAIFNRQQLEKYRSILDGFTIIPYRHHSDRDFQYSNPMCVQNGKFRYPPFDPHRDQLAIVVDTRHQGFLPRIVEHFIGERKHHQQQHKATAKVYHFNQQLCIKISINSMYGIMGSKRSVLGYAPVAMAIVNICRLILLESYHYLRRLGFEMCYADTDSLMVHLWPENNCDRINQFLNLRHMELKFEQRMKLLLVLCKKRYAYIDENDQCKNKGFMKRTNGLIEYMSKQILKFTLRGFQGESIEDPVASAYIKWVEVLTRAQYMVRDPKTYSIIRKTKRLSEYKGGRCPTQVMALKHPDKENEHVEYSYHRADVDKTKVLNWVDDVENISRVDFDELIKCQKKVFIDLLNAAYWKSPKASKMCDMVLNHMRWQHFVRAELLHKKATGNGIIMLIPRQLAKYTFCINDHCTGDGTRYDASLNQS